MERISWETILREISLAPNVGELRTLRDRTQESVQGYPLFVPSIEWGHDVNAFHDAIIRRVIDFALAEMIADGFGPAPASFAFLLFGSGGRREQTLWSDQDNGLVYADADDPEGAAAYFRELAARATAGLEAAGYPPCSGEVVCTNEKWCKPLSGYIAMLQEWLREPVWENVRYLLIVADMRVISGDEALGRRLIDELYSYVKSHPVMLEHLLQNTLHHKVSLGVFGQLIKERYGEDSGGVEIKYGAYIPIVNGVRLLAIDAGLYETSTEKRIEALVERHLVDEEIGHDWMEALSIALKLRSLTPYQIENNQYTTRGKLTAEQLTKERATELKLCLRIGNDLQKYVKKHVHKELDKG